MKANGLCVHVHCVCNCSYGFMPIALKLYSCYGHGLKVCMWFGYNPRTSFCHFFHNLNLVIFFGHFSEWIEGTLCAQLLLLLLLNFNRHCDHALKICMWLGYTHQVNFCHFLLQFELIYFSDISHLESEVPVGGIVFHKHIFLFFHT